MASLPTRIRQESPPLLLPSSSAPSSSLRLVAQAPFSTSEPAPYVLHVVPLPTSSGGGYLFASSDDTIQHFSAELQPLRVLKSSQRGITSMTRGAGEGSTAVFITARDGTVTGWDTNDLSKEAFKLRSSSGAGLLCASQSSDLSCLAVGGELHHYETTIDLWNLATLKLQHTYTEAHSDDITSLKFHPSPSLPHVLLSASVDGLLNTYDVRIQDEDDSVLSTSQVGTSLIDAGWMARIGHAEEVASGEWKGVWATTTIETMQLWDVDDQSLIKDLGDIREVALEPWRSDYLISATYSPHLGGVAIFVGTQKGDAALLNLSDPRRWILEQNLPGVGGRTLGGKGHGDIVRCATMNTQTGIVATGGEDGRVCLWSV
ncbi:BZ3500_MvSof-1268-A1-R1_Chr6-3g09000 [Microbotryum saponariae]|uniref:BZ3500_MvSof-1268-A1-R1_Chr6-3g09000 protein n=1 Tax=Microbotryum saponariae TaxID=289078 RepID=A0A2X0NI89_9BASI|nr:BZ3500_MvSof-1268-A1-R1_Chr6-3g09000 [Microbotryum saponariae]SDA07602.1 BZ3501_MvSof-1269-A2-R1_Chr6-2g08704 [Microbotryum saponariae]